MGTPYVPLGGGSSLAMPIRLVHSADAESHDQVGMDLGARSVLRRQIALLWRNGDVSGDRVAPDHQSRNGRIFRTQAAHRNRSLEGSARSPRLKGSGDA